MPSAPGATAWLVSMLVHLGLFVLVLFLVQLHAPRDMVDEPTREVGIVLVHQRADGPRFEGEETLDLGKENPITAETITPNETNFRDASLNGLPSAAELQQTRSMLPQPVSSPSYAGLTGPLSPETGRARSAAALTRGGKPSTRGGGRPAHVSLFGVEGVGSKFVYLFDRSVSMEGTLLAAAKKQLITSLESLQSVHQFQIIFFNYEVQIWDLTGGQQRIPFATDRNKQLATNYVRGISAMGGTLRRKALQRALVLHPDVVFFLTDTDNKMAANDVTRAIGQAVRSGITIHTIEFGFGPNSGSSAASGKNFLIQLADGTNGQYVYIDTSSLGR